MTVGLLAVVVYLYTVVAFNFFRKFYNKSEDEDEPDMKCDDMMTCYLFHMYVGVRAGGGIGDEIEDPAGDDYELYRVVFDITFFFFVIVILLAIIQGGHWGVWGHHHPPGLHPGWALGGLGSSSSSWPSSRVGTGGSGVIIILLAFIQGGHWGCLAPSPNKRCQVSLHPRLITAPLRSPKTPEA
ncbi:PREDICTED: ryanodine receptor 1-like [Ficedula albicollis]|uniref:ryanodine receptor 1-like n=1 Tax=Ficedula albicollis TaxID=59894 RepID=UPI0003594121|nr:PREDICTED: ryanodine receptor 1-like [Ficedula albicollis]